MDTPGAATLALQILAGTGLAAAAGLKAFLPPFMVGLLARLDLFELRPGLSWLESTPALIILGTAVVVELAADKIPLIDHVLDAAETLIKPAAGAVVAAAAFVDLSPLWAGVLALAVGGGVAGTVHLAKSGLRLASTGTTGGLGNPALSVLEDGLSLGAVLVAVFAPLLLLLILILGLLLLRRMVRWMQAQILPRPLRH
jgi:hypothetical protein